MQDTPKATPRLLSLQRLAALRGVEGRASAVRALVEMILANENFARPAEREAFLGKTVELIRASDRETRRQIARRLSRCDKPPRALLEPLLQDEFPVCAILLQGLAHLEEHELLAVLREGTREHALAVARRTELPRRVIAELVRLDDSDILQALCDSHALFPAEETDTGQEESPLSACSAESLALLFWAAPADARASVVNELMRRQVPEPLPPLFAEDACSAMRTLAHLGTPRDLTRALHSLTGAGTLAAALINSEESGLALAAACRVIQLGDDVFTQVLLRLSHPAAMSLARLHSLHAIYLRLEPGTALCLLRGMDADFAPWVEFASPLPRARPPLPAAHNAVSEAESSFGARDASGQRRDKGEDPGRENLASPLGGAA